MSEYKQILEALQQINKQLEAISEQLKLGAAAAPYPVAPIPFNPPRMPTVPGPAPIWYFKQTVTCDSTGR